MSIKRFEKDSSEKYPIRITYTNSDGTTSYTISSLSVVATDTAGNDVSTSLISSSDNTYSSNVANVWVRNGVAGTVYSIEAHATMSSGEILTKKFQLVVT